MSEKLVKKRNWALVVYPDSLPDDWLSILTRTGLPIAISPLHDQDIDESTGELKKAHRHLIVVYPGPTTFNSVSVLAHDLHTVMPIPIDSVRGAYRYLTHKDNPEKAQYSESDIQCLNGFNFLDFVEFTKNEIEVIKKRVHALIRERNILEYADLLDQLLDEDLNDEYTVASSNTLLFRSYINSRRHKMFPAKEDM